MAKVSVYLDDRTLDQLRRRAVAERGTVRSLSREIEELVNESFVLEELEQTVAEWMEGRPGSFGLRDIRPMKVGPGLSVTEVVREEREHRHEVPARRQRRAQAVRLEGQDDRSDGHL